jgi:hypothetical protein
MDRREAYTNSRTSLCAPTIYLSLQYTNFAHLEVLLMILVVLPNVFPSTLHSSHGDQLHISFNEEHHLVLKTEDGIHHDQMVFTYVFFSADDRKRFQEDLRDKNLVETFDFDALWSKRIPLNAGGESILQDLKIWQDRYLPYHHSISFFATTGEERHVEFPILWFQRIDRNDTSNLKVVHLDFIGRKESAPSPGTAVRRRWTLERFSSSVSGKSSPKGKFDSSSMHRLTG